MISNLLLNGFEGILDFLYASPLILVLRPSGENVQAFKDVDDIVNSASFNPQFSRALIKRNHALFLSAIKAEKSAAKLAQTLVLSRRVVL